MPSTQIANPGGAFGNTASGSQELVELINNSGTTRTDGDLVVVDVTGTLATTTTTANVKTVIGVVSSFGSTATASAAAIASGKPMMVAVGGVARINIAANTIAVGDILCASTAAGVAVTNNSATVGQAIAIALEADSAKDANNTVRALIKKM